MPDGVGSTTGGALICTSGVIATNGGPATPRHDRPDILGHELEPRRDEARSGRAAHPDRPVATVRVVARLHLDQPARTTLRRSSRRRRRTGPASPRAVAAVRAGSAGAARAAGRGVVRRQHAPARASPSGTGGSRAASASRRVRRYPERIEAGEHGAARHPHRRGGTGLTVGIRVLAVVVPAASARHVRPAVGVAAGRRPRRPTVTSATCHRQRSWEPSPNGSERRSRRRLSRSGRYHRRPGAAAPEVSRAARAAVRADLDEQDLAGRYRQPSDDVRALGWLADGPVSCPPSPPSASMLTWRTPAGTTYRRWAHATSPITSTPAATSSAEPLPRRRHRIRRPGQMGGGWEEPLVPRTQCTSSADAHGRRTAQADRVVSLT